MGKPVAMNVAARAVELATGPRIGYNELDCQAFVEQCVNDCGGKMAYAGSNDMARNAVVWMGTIANAKAEGKLVPGAGLLIHEDDESGLPAKYKGDGLGDFSHVGLYVGKDALYDTDKQGKKRLCDVVHSSSSMGRVAGSTLQNGWTHVVWFKEIDYGVEVTPGVTIGAEIAVSDALSNQSQGQGPLADGSGGQTGREASADAPTGADVQSTKAEAAGLRYAVVTAPSGSTVNIRPQPKKGDLYWAVSVGVRVSVERVSGGWALINAVCVDGVPRRAWMMDKFLEYEE